MSWLSEHAINVDQLDDDFDIDHGLPKWLEEVAGPMFFPRLWRGVDLRNGRHVQVRRANTANKYAIDLAVYVDDAPWAGIDVERKRPSSARLFESDLPVNVPVYTLRAHRSGDYVSVADGGPAYSGKVRMFRRYPAQTFFMAVRHDATKALMVRGSDVVDESRWEWMLATGDYANGEIYVSRVPRELAVECPAAGREAEDFVLDVIGPRLEQAA